MHLVCANKVLCAQYLVEPVVELLLDLGADPNDQDQDCCTPLTVASAHREWELCRKLLGAMLFLWHYLRVQVLLLLFILTVNVNNNI